MLSCRRPRMHQSQQGRTPCRRGTDARASTRKLPGRRRHRPLPARHLVGQTPELQLPVLRPLHGTRSSSSSSSSSSSPPGAGPWQPSPAQRVPAPQPCMLGPGKTGASHTRPACLPACRSPPTQVTCVLWRMSGTASVHSWKPGQQTCCVELHVSALLSPFSGSLLGFSHRAAVCPGPA